MKLELLHNQTIIQSESGIPCIDQDTITDFVRKHYSIEDLNMKPSHTDFGYFELLHGTMPTDYSVRLSLLEIDT